MHVLQGEDEIFLADLEIFFFIVIFRQFVALYGRFFFLITLNKENKSMSKKVCSFSMQY